MIVRITPGIDRKNSGEEYRFHMPPDKSVLHRLLIIGSLTQTAFTIPIANPQAISHDIIATILALESLGVPIEIFEDRIELQGVGLNGLHEPNHRINCANSGTTARLLMGLLAGQDFSTTLIGDSSLSQRPMKRLSDILVNKLGAEIKTSEGGTLPVTISGRPLKGGEITLAVASAQMKSAILLASLKASDTVKVSEPGQSRDHTERMLIAFGGDVEVEEDWITSNPIQSFMLKDEIEYNVPGDLSSAAFLIAAAILLKKNVTIERVLLNPTRTRFLEILTLMGVEFIQSDITMQWDEEVGTLTVYGEYLQELTPFEIGKEDVPLLIDELPMLALIGALANGESRISGARELRLKESDRLKGIAEQFQKFGIPVTEQEDGLIIFGSPNRKLHAVAVDHKGDHRLLMVFALAAFLADEPIELQEAEVVKVSYPTFFSDLQQMVGSEGIHVLIDEKA